MGAEAGFEEAARLPGEIRQPLPQLQGRVRGDGAQNARVEAGREPRRPAGRVGMGEASAELGGRSPG